MTADPVVKLPVAPVCKFPCTNTFPPKLAAWPTFRDDEIDTELMNWLTPPTLRPPEMPRFDVICAEPWT